MDLKNRKAFTMLELIFVIVVIGILSAIAVPKFAATRDDATVSKARSDVAAMRSAIAMERQKRILRGNFGNITNAEVPGLLEYGLDSIWSGLTVTIPNVGSCAFSAEIAGSRNKLVKGTCTISGMSDL